MASLPKHVSFWRGGPSEIVVGRSKALASLGSTLNRVEKGDPAKVTSGTCRRYPSQSRYIHKRSSMLVSRDPRRVFDVGRDQPFCVSVADFKLG